MTLDLSIFQARDISSSSASEGEESGLEEEEISLKKSDKKKISKIPKTGKSSPYFNKKAVSKVAGLKCKKSILHGVKLLSFSF